MNARHALAALVLLLAPACAGRSKLEVAPSEGSAGAGGTGGTAGTGGSAGAPLACEANLQTDPEHCGRCFHSCEGGTCLAGQCLPVPLLRYADRAPTALAVDAEHVWFTPPFSRVGLGGGAPESLAMVSGDVWGVAVDGDYGFWVNVSDGLMRFDRATNAVDVLGVSGYRVALDADYAYTTRTGVWRVPRAGGEPEQLTSMSGEGIAVDAEYVYFTVPSGGGLFRLPKAGGEPEPLTLRSSSSYVAAWNGRVYVSEQDPPTGVFEVTGPGLRTLVASLEEPFGVVADDFGVFWADWAEGVIWMRSQEYGSVPVQLATGQPFPRDVAVDARAVYWTNDDTTKPLMKVAKP